MYEKYNTVLRAKSGNEFLMAKFGKVCKGNLYVTTIHAINSGILKLSRMQRACTVWRGVHGGVLPEQFWTENEHGVMGGVERAFMSTTTSRDVAEGYARQNGSSVAMLFKIRMGMIDRGASIAFLSQFPVEAE